MRAITFQDCVEFQNCFLFDGKFSPFENIDNFQTFYPHVLIGEIGGLINLSCKTARSVNIYDDEIKDECADIFIYLLLFGRMLEIHDDKKVLGAIAERWSDPLITTLKTEEDFYHQCIKMLKMVLCFLEPGSESYYSERHFYEIFSTIRQVSEFKTKLSWQEVINTFHKIIIHRHTNPASFTMDWLYRGSGRMNIKKLLQFIRKIDMDLPVKRIEFLERIMEIQSKIWMVEPFSNGAECEELSAQENQRHNIAWSY